MVKLISKDVSKNEPLVSILILNYNGLKYVDKCLASILRTNYSNFEIIFIDNASIDGSCEYVERRYGDNLHLKIIKNERNYGFAKGNNIGARYAKGDYLVFLNVDTEVEPDWLRELVRLMDSDSRKEYSFLNVVNRDVIDIGMNIGDSTIYFALNGARRVIGLEPYPYAFSYAKINV
jgi:GT2 family glycosyltransferase